MKMLLIAPALKARRLRAFGLAAPEDEVVAVSSRRELAEVSVWDGFHLAVLDWSLPDATAPALLAMVREAAPELPVVALVPDVRVAAEARRAGAAEALIKPLQAEGGRAVLQRLARAGAADAGADPLAELRFVTQSPVMENVLSVAWRVAPTSASVLILGENGTGKTMLARAIHARSARRAGPFVSVNCPCLQPQLLESELFGHVRGSFTGAISDTQGKVAAADGGTLFLDEVGELPAEIQAKLLRLLQERCYERVGETRTHRADIRVLAATNRDLRQLVAAGTFREDLYYRMNVITLEMPPLRSRPEDIVPSAQHFLQLVSRNLGVPRRDLTLPAREALVAHSWPGNLRELRNVIERAAILCDRQLLDARDFPELANRPEPATPQVGEFVTLEALIEAHIRRVTARAESYEQAARILGIDKSTLYRWRKRLEGFEAAPAETARAS
jgi:NtrC-family two-component system response regulator AlgB